VHSINGAKDEFLVADASFELFFMHLEFLLRLLNWIKFFTGGAFIPSFDRSYTCEDGFYVDANMHYF